ncbi:electron transfer flavoprotein subunit beta [Serratia rhizosphaerae]|uniref:Electron transfer flavoprotein subunit beta n=1 Tax=Serratia rhizosphaerae TaxID=2597702 RepID=A0ABX6GR55_9GAMM|nr:electron transfer flavoprotein subunit beta [Serratia rhizosphaerae]QHA88757.1 electron transfer flavoprotein subunit beta [Serratia rhizosphaerae]
MRPEKHHADLRVTALVSIGKHPGSARERRAGQDARAVELGMTLASDGLEVLHAGDPHAEALRSYAGMGLDVLRVLDQEESADVVPALCRYLSQDKPDIILTGVRAESGESSGMLPYLLGEALGMPVVTGIADIVAVDGGEAQLLQALPRGQRRALRVPLPFIASVDLAAPAPRQSAFGPASRARLESTPAGIVCPDEVRAQWSEAPARKRPKRLQVVKAKTAADRFKAATAKSQGDGGRILRDKPAPEMAQAIFDLLLEEGVVRGGR